MTRPPDPSFEPPPAAGVSPASQRLSEHHCPWCQEPRTPTARFCSNCGAALGAADEADRGPAAHASEGRAPFTSERKRVSILFADICDSTRMIDDLDPEEAVRALEPPLIAIRESVRRFGGTVSEVRGDGVMALFGAPLAQEDHAIRACYAALAIHRAVAALAGPTVRVRVGVNSGEVVVRAIRSDMGFDYTAVGSVVHLAARLEQSAAPETTVLGEATHRLARESVVARPLDGVLLKGHDTPERVFELQSADPAKRSRWELRVAAGLRGFFGRERQLARLDRSLARARETGRAAVRIHGGAGVGKSRLVHEFGARAEAAGWTVLAVHGSPLDRSSPYFPLRRTLVEWLGASVGTDAAGLARRLGERLAAWSPEHAIDRAPLEALLDLEVSDPTWDGIGPERRRTRTVDALRSLWHGSPTPLIAVFEDVPWMDEETRAVFERVLDGSGPTPILVVWTVRSETSPGPPAGIGAEDIALEPLDAPSARALLADHLGDHPGLVRLVELVAEQTGGVPLFIEETIRLLAETGVIRGGPGNFRPARSFGDVEIPASVEAALAERVDRLPRGEKRLLQTAAAIGTVSPLSILMEASELDEASFDRAVAALQHHGFVRRVGAGGESVAFRHALTRDVAYGLLLERERRPLHERILHALERLAASGPSDLVDLLGYHALRSLAFEKAARYLEQAGLKAIHQSAHREAVAVFEDALRAVGSMPRSVENLRRSVRLRLLLRGCLIPSGDVTRVAYHLERAEEEAESAGDIRSLGLVYATSTLSDWLGGHPEQGVEAGLRARTISERVDDLTLRVVTRVGLGLCLHGAGRFREAVDVYGDLLGLLTGELESKRFNSTAYPAVLARAFLAHSLAELGETERAGETALAGIDLARRVKDPFGLALARLGAAHHRLLRDDLSGAGEILEEALADCARRDLPTVAVALAAELAWVRAEAGDLEAGRRTLERVADVADDQQIPQWSIDLRLLGMSRLALAAGDAADALRHGEAALRRARVHGDRGTLGWAALACAEAALLGADGRADRYLDEAATLARAEGRRPLAAHALRVRARASAGRARIESAEAASKAFDALGLPGRAREAAALGSSERD